MKIILKEDLEKLGKCGDVIQVRDGYAANYLFPRNLAIPATRGNLSSIQELTRQKKFRDEKKIKGAEKFKSDLEKISITAEVKVGEEDRVFGSVTSQDIADLLKDKGFVIDKRKIELEEPIKALGVYTVPIKIQADIVANLKLWVVKKGEE
jgi:large subunit ribosomal protein L9